MQEAPNMISIALVSYLLFFFSPLPKKMFLCNDLPYERPGEIISGFFKMQPFVSY